MSDSTKNVSATESNQLSAGEQAISPLPTLIDSPINKKVGVDTPLSFTAVSAGVFSNSASQTATAEQQVTPTGVIASVNSNNTNLMFSGRPAW